jgi:hypothetical protein
MIVNDCAVHLDELFWVTGAIIFVDRPRLELVRPGDLPDRALVPERETRPSQMVWRLALENVDGEMTIRL